MIDTHAHIEYPDFSGEEAALIEAAQKEGVEKFIAVGGEIPRNHSIMSLIDQFDCLYGALGVHPNWANTNTIEHQAWIESNLAHAKIIAVGEIGLDYHYNYSRYEDQDRVFRAYLEIAQKNDLPVIIHSREACQETIAILSEYPDLKGVMHCFSYDIVALEKLLEMGLHISFCGPLTFKKSDQLREVSKSVPLERLLLETDCPFMAPEPKRGRQNRPEYVKYIAEMHAKIRGISFSEIDEITTANAIKLFKLNRIKND